MDSLIPLDQIVLEIRFYSQQTALNMIEVGKRLIEAKQHVPHGEWEQWLEKRVDLSYRSAARFMQAAREVSNLPTLATLSQSKICAILDLPVDQRESFIQDNPVEQMSTRQVQAAVKAQKEAEKRAIEIEEENKMLRQENKKLAAQKPQVIEKPIEVVKIPDDYDEIKDQVKQLAQENEQLQDEKNELTRAQILLQNQHRLRSTVRMLGDEIGKYAKRIAFEYRTLPNDEIANKAILACSEILRQTADELEEITRSVEIEYIGCD